MANSVQFTDINEQVFSKLKQQLSSMGINLKGNSGRISEKGVSADYSFDEQTGSLAISNVKVGFPASMMYNADKIVQKIAEAVESSGGRMTV